MKANELRLNNWVWNEVQNIAVKVDLRIIQDQIYADKGLKDPWQPIPLTEEIFEKLPQFKKVPFFDDDGYYFEFNLDCGLCLLSGDNNDVFVSDLENVRYEFLHQLQNLYFALTGEELGVNL